MAGYKLANGNIIWSFLLLNLSASFSIRTMNLVQNTRTYYE